MQKTLIRLYFSKFHQLQRETLISIPLKCQSNFHIQKFIHLATYLRIADAVRNRPDKSKLTFNVCDHNDQQYDDEMRRNLCLNAHIVELKLITDEYWFKLFSD